ncbi:MAG TPA: HPF/RaiA family ribosome-associated protein [Gemmatimonadales bacterium]|nr:HPF/RaiA family ribosome-associated protein [Gemmatimonadales bacterium]
MQLDIASRHATLEPTLERRTHEIAERLGRLGPRALQGTAVFDTVAGLPWVELRVHCSGGATLIATATADDHRTALDVVDRKMRRQLRRTNTRPRAARHATAT